MKRAALSCPIPTSITIQYFATSSPVTSNRLQQLEDMTKKPAKEIRGGEMIPHRGLANYRDIENELVGFPGTPERDQFEQALNVHLIPFKIRQFRKLHNLTQSELGARIGVQKTQISKLERSALNITIDTLLKVFKALHVKVDIIFTPEVTTPAQNIAKAILLLATVSQWAPALFGWGFFVV